MTAGLLGAIVAGRRVGDPGWRATARVAAGLLLVLPAFVTLTLARLALRQLELEPELVGSLAAFEGR